MSFKAFQITAIILSVLFGIFIGIYGEVLNLPLMIGFFIVTAIIWVIPLSGEFGSQANSDSLAITMPIILGGIALLGVIAYLI